MVKCQACLGAGWVKFYVTRDAPGLPTWLKTSKDAEGKGIRWLSALEGYYLVRCPSCNADEVAHAEAA